MTAKDHNKLLGIFLLIHGGLQAFGGLMVFLIYGGLGVSFMGMARRSSEQAMGGIFLAVGVVAGIFVLALASVFLLSGWKIFKEKVGARTWGIVGSCLALLGFPLGTALGIYGLWFLTSDAGKEYYAGGHQMNYSAAPPPHNWQ